MLVRLGAARLGSELVPRLGCRAVRSLYSLTGVVEPHLASDTLHQVEAHWKPRLAASLPQPKPDAPKYYVLSMFPYPR